MLILLLNAAFWFWAAILSWLMFAPFRWWATAAWLISMVAVSLAVRARR
jgi:hypothetical protein